MTGGSAYFNRTNVMSFSAKGTTVESMVPKGGVKVGFASVHCSVLESHGVARCVAEEETTQHGRVCPCAAGACFWLCDVTVCPLPCAESRCSAWAATSAASAASGTAPWTARRSQALTTNPSRCVLHVGCSGAALST